MLRFCYSGDLCARISPEEQASTGAIKFFGSVILHDCSFLSSMTTFRRRMHQLYTASISEQARLTMSWPRLRIFSNELTGSLFVFFAISTTCLMFITTNTSVYAPAYVIVYVLFYSLFWIKINRKMPLFPTRCGNLSSEVASSSLTLWNSHH